MGNMIVDTSYVRNPTALQQKKIDKLVKESEKRHSDNKKRLLKIRKDKFDSDLPYVVAPQFVELGELVTFLISSRMRNGVRHNRLYWKNMKKLDVYWSVYGPDRNKSVSSIHARGLEPDLNVLEDFASAMCLGHIEGQYGCF